MTGEINSIGPGGCEQRTLSDEEFYRLLRDIIEKVILEAKHKQHEPRHIEEAGGTKGWEPPTGKRMVWEERPNVWYVKCNESGLFPWVDVVYTLDDALYLWHRANAL